MPIRSHRQYQFIPPSDIPIQPLNDFSGGRNTRESILATGPTELAKADNIRYRAIGGFKKRPGSQRYGQKIGASTKILGLHSYVNKANVATLLTTFNTDIYKYSESNSVVTVATSTNAQGVGYAKDRKVFVTTAVDANGLPYIATLYQTGAGIKLEWEDTPYDTWTNTVISVDASTQVGFFGFMDASDNIHVAYMSDANTVKYVKLTYAAGPTWSVGTAVTVKGSGASDSAVNPCIYVQTNGTIHIAYRYYNGSVYQAKAILSTDSGATWTSETGLSTASANTRHFATMCQIQGFPLVFYQVGEASATSFYFRFWTGSWSAQTLSTSVTTSTDNAFSAVVTGNTLSYTVANAASSTGLSFTAFTNAMGAQRRRFNIVADGANDNDVQYYNTIGGTEDSSATRVSNDSNNNLYPTSPEYVPAATTFLPVMWIEGTGSPYNIKINTSANWIGLSAGLTTNLPMNSAYFPNSGAGGTDQIYLTNGTDTMKKWDGTTVTSANASYPKSKWIFFMDGRLWMDGGNNRAYYTNLGDDGFGAALPSGNTVDFPEQPVWGHWYRDSVAFIFTRFSIYVINNFSYSGANVGAETIRRLPNSYGTLSGRTVKQVGYWVYFQSPDGHVRRTNGQSVEFVPVSDKIRGDIEGLAPSQLQYAAAGTLGNYYYLAVTNSGSGQNDLWLVLDTAIFERNGGGWSVDTGKTTSCFVTHPDSSGVPQLFWGEATTTNGTVYKGETGSNDNGAAIDMHAQTGVQFFGNPYMRKHIQKAVVNAQATGSYNLTFGYSKFTNNASFTDKLISVATNAPVWGAFVWGNFTWGGNANVESVVPLDIRERGVQFRFRNNAANQDIQVFGFSVSSSIIKDSM